MKDLNPQQKLAVQAPDLPLLIIAGAGTGKTKTLTSRLSYLVNEKGVSPDKICAITFTNKAAEEMRNHISAVSCKSPIVGQFIGTFHSLGAKILRSECQFVGRKSNFVIFDDYDSLRLIKNILKKKKENDEKQGAAFIMKKISQIKNDDPKLLEGIDGKGYSVKQMEEKILELFKIYEAELQKNNAFDFDDLIYKPVEIFKNNPQILQKYRKRYQYILVDEYQDLNNKQYEFIKLLAGDSNKISVVGDDAQTIYSWRGSNINIFLNFEKDWPESKIVFLEQNYRSTSNIIEAASCLIKNNLIQSEARKTKNLWTKNPPGEKIKILEFEDEKQEAEWISEQISNSELLIPNENQDSENQETIAILYRTNAQSRAIEEALIQKQISYQIFGGIKFYERLEIKDIIAALRYTSNPKDEISLERLEKNFSKSKFSLIKSMAGKKIKPVEAINEFLKAADYLDYLEKNFLNCEERQENIAELIRFASAFENLEQFLEQVALIQPIDQINKQRLPDASHKLPVNLMTIHLAKGLEFDRVYVVGCNEGLLPHARSLKNNWELEEERRLMYVAMTRAKLNLTLSCYDTPSRFLGEIPEQYIDFLNLRPENEGFSGEEYIRWD